MVFASKLDEYGKPAWLALTVLGFWFYWPIGLALLLFLAFSGRLRAWRMERRGRWYNTGGYTMGGPFARGWGCGGSGRSGNRAFDEYRAETLKRLEEEQREFVEYLERLRQARDKAEFDQFMADRRNRPPPATADAPSAP